MRLSIAQEKSIHILRDLATQNETWMCQRELHASDFDIVRDRLLPRVESLEQRLKTLEGREPNNAGKNLDAAADMKESIAIVIKKAWKCYIEEREAGMCGHLLSLIVSTKQAKRITPVPIGNPPKDMTHDWANVVLRQDSL